MGRGGGREKVSRDSMCIYVWCISMNVHGYEGMSVCP